MILKIAWRNIWRHPVRSSVVIIAIAIGLWAGVFLMSFYFGLIDQRVQDVIENEVSHIQIHHPDFEEDQDIKFDLPDAQQMVAEIKEKPEVIGASARVLVNAMVGSARGNAGVTIRGIDPEGENKLMRLSSKVVEGNYFEGIKRNPVLIGEKLAEKLKVKLRSKIVLTFQNEDGDITSGAFRVVGLYKTVNSKYDEMNVFVRSEDIRKLLGKEIGFHEIAILLKEHDQVDSVHHELKATYSDLLVERWLDVLPEMQYMTQVMDMFMAVFILIIMLAVMFGIINTMLMAILERTREIGVLTAVGMNKQRVFMMILTETVMLTLIGVPAGFLLGYGTIELTSRTGIDFSFASEAMASFGYTTLIYPMLEFKYYTQTAIQVFVLAVLAAIYPAWRALRLKPADAIRKI